MNPLFIRKYFREFGFYGFDEILVDGYIHEINMLKGFRNTIVGEYYWH